MTQEPAWCVRAVVIMGLASTALAGCSQLVGIGDLTSVDAAAAIDASASDTSPADAEPSSSSDAALDAVGGVVDAPPPDAGAPFRLRVVAANLTSGNVQSYDAGPGIRILAGLHPDVILLQTMNYGDNSAAAIDSFIQQLGAGFTAYYREPSGAIPNGVVSRYPIVASGTAVDPQASNRGFAWAHIDLPGTRDLWAVSLNFLTSNASTRDLEAGALVSFINANVPANDYLVVGGTLNTSLNTEPCLTTLSSVVGTSAPYPVDQNANSNTSATRTKPYDWVLPDADLASYAVPLVIGASTYPDGLVVDTRIYTPLAEIAPALVGDSGATNMQHMAVARDFLLTP